MESHSDNFFTQGVVNQFMIRRNLINDDFAFQKIKEDTKLTKRAIGLYQRALASFEKDGSSEQVEAVKERLTKFQEQQASIDLELTNNKNNQTNLNTWIDLHGSTLAQGPRVLMNHISNLQECFITGQMNLNCGDAHVLQVITGPGKLSDRICDYLTIAGFNFYGDRAQGHFLVKLTNKATDKAHNQERIAQHAKMTEEHKAQWAQMKTDLQNQKKSLRNELKEEKKVQRQKDNEDKKAERQKEKAEKRAERTSEKDEFKTKKRAIKAGMKELGFAGYQIKQIGKPLNYSSLEECVKYAQENDITPKPKDRSDKQNRSHKYTKHVVIHSGDQKMF